MANTAALHTPSTNGSHHRTGHGTEAPLPHGPKQPPATRPDSPQDSGLKTQDFSLPALLSDYTTAALPLEGLAARHKLTLPHLLDILESREFLDLLERIERVTTRRVTAIARAAATDTALALRDINARFFSDDAHPEPVRKASNNILRLALPPAPAASAAAGPRPSSAEPHNTAPSTEHQHPSNNGVRRASEGHPARSASEDPADATPTRAPDDIDSLLSRVGTLLPHTQPRPRAQASGASSYMSWAPTAAPSASERGIFIHVVGTDSSPERKRAGHLHRRRGHRPQPRAQASGASS